MSIQELGYEFDPYSYLLFVPVGRRYSTIRSIGHKEERAVLSRIQQSASEALSKLTSEQRKQLSQFVGTDEPMIPIPVYKQEHIYPMLVRPEMFLWTTHSLQRGLPIDHELFYEKTYSKLSAEQLDEHIRQVVRDYVFCAHLHQQERSQWIDRIAAAFKTHPFIELAESKEPIVNAVETMNRSSLLAVLKYPEDIAFWRHRVEIVMRPYRQIPGAWRWDVCNHAKELRILDETQSLQCECPICQFQITYDVEKNEVILPEEPIMERTVKRIATIERQFNEIADQSKNVIESLQELQTIKEQLKKHAPLLEEILDLQNELEEENDMELIRCYKALKEIQLPKEHITPELLSLAKVTLKDVAVLKESRKWAGIDFRDAEAQFHDLKTHLIALQAERQPKPGDIIFETNGFQLTRAEAEKVEYFTKQTDLTLSFHILSQVLKGEPTNKIRTLQLHEASIFGLLRSWPEKYITKAVKYILH
ncbi:RQC-minor-2 family DNA-binding protein [Jeotgalibacillus aurantiacus]|uniref:RQC-minor-2 family DNA-binding protein n=1 Tax=Jeotgalibacillus aurantiacus TaxID=2763266 RepID=UPI001D0B9B83|nr:RQC-minor-2 family DNA-binding protein [Jeotgalibacillus aurantiacus]